MANENNVLYHNNGNTNAWLIIRPIGAVSNRDAVGAQVRVTATIRGRQMQQMRQIGGGAPGDPRAHFGLGAATTADLVRIEWPSGIVQEFENVAANQLVTVTEHQPRVPDVPSLTASRPAAGPLQLTVTGQVGVWYVLETSTDFVQWRKAAIGRNTTGSVQFTPPASPSPHQFYRVVVP